MTPSTKQFIATAKLFNKNNPGNPIWENVNLLNTKAFFHDHDFSVEVPFVTGLNTCLSIREMVSALQVFTTPSFHQANNSQVEISSGKQKVKLSGEDPANFPLPISTKNPFDVLGTIHESTLAELNRALSFTSKDDLRPVYQTVYVKDYVVATDCHRMFYYPLENPLNESVQLSERVIKIMAIYRGNWSVKKAGKVNGHTTVFLENNDGVVISFTYDYSNRPFPKWEYILPSDQPTQMECDKKELRSLIKTGSAFSNCVAKHCKIALNGSAKYSTSDKDFKREFEAEFVASYNNDMVITFDYTLLDSILAKVDTDNIKMKISDSRKVVMINDNFLLMPVMS